MFTPEQVTSQLSNLNQANLEKTIRLSNIALSGVERLMTLQLEIAKNLLAENAQTVKTLTEVKDVQGLVALQQSLSQPSVDKALSIAKNVFDAASQTQTELNQLVEEQVIEFNKNVVTALDKAVKNAPAGSDVAVNAVKTAMATAASAYDTIKDAAKKVTTEMTEAGTAAVNKATAAATATVKAAAPKASAKAADAK